MAEDRNTSEEATDQATRPAAGPEAAANAMADPLKRSRFATILSALAGDDFKTIVDAVTGSSSHDFNRVLRQVRTNDQRIAAAEARVREREKQITEIGRELDRLREQNIGLEGQINRIKSIITVRTAEDATRLAGSDLLD